MKTKYFMSACFCRRDHVHNETCVYQVKWSLNPYTRVGETCIQEASFEHDSLRNALCEMGAEVQLMDFIEGAYDSVFLKDNAVLFERDGNLYSVLASPKHRERKIEIQKRIDELERIGFQTLIQPKSVFEGGDFIFMPHSHCAFMGYGQRSEKQASYEIEKAFGIEVIPLELRDPYMYHLDLSLGVLSDGTAFACREAFTQSSWQLLKACFAGSDLIEVPREAALNFDLNWAETPRGIVHSLESRFVPNILRERGWETLAVPLSQFEAAGGSVACLVSRVWQARSARAQAS